ncbi:MAG TPA: ABC transporter permease [Clostridiales bacterium]|nr:ABC transporter permease [Clostridiales bacterium]
MSFRLYRTRLKAIIRNKENIFWSYMFPILLASLFYFAFGNLRNNEAFETIDIGYVAVDNEVDQLLETMEEAKISEETLLFNVTAVSRDTAAKRLENGEIEAYIVAGEEPVLFVKENGINETITKSFLDSYSQTISSVETIIMNNPVAIEEGLLDDLQNVDTFVYEEKTSAEPEYILIYFYALFAFTCIFAGVWGLDEVINIQADMSITGARVSISPVHKMKLLFSNMFAAFTAHIGSVFLLLFFLKYVLDISFGDSFLGIVIICVMGSLAGLAQGVFLGIMLKQKPAVKTGLQVTITMLESFLAGFMIADMKYIIADKAPILSYINPVNLVSDALYSLYYYETNERFLLNITILGSFTVILSFLSYLRLRRKTYASI